jgi:hypothetical protein
VPSHVRKGVKKVVDPNKIAVEKSCSGTGFLSLHYHDSAKHPVGGQCECESCQNCDGESCNCHGNSS